MIKNELPTFFDKVEFVLYNLPIAGSTFLIDNPSISNDIFGFRLAQLHTPFFWCRLLSF